MLGKVEVDEKMPRMLNPNCMWVQPQLVLESCFWFGGREELGRDSYFSVPGPEEVMLPAP